MPKVVRGKRSSEKGTEMDGGDEEEEEEEEDGDADDEEGGLPGETSGSDEDVVKVVFTRSTTAHPNESSEEGEYEAPPSLFLFEKRELHSHPHQAPTQDKKTEIVEEVVKGVEETEREPIRGTLEAKEIYILMSKEYRISRNRRAEWFFNNVNQSLPFPPPHSLEEESNPPLSAEINNGSKDFEVVSIIPLNPSAEWSFDSRHSFLYRVNPETRITYLSRRYRIVFCLDISPSTASVDVQAGGVVFDNLFRALQASLNGLLQPFVIPGSGRSFRPEIFLTVIAHAPFYSPVSDQILVQGQLLEKATCKDILKHVFHRLNQLENKVASVVQQKIRRLKLSSDLLSSFHTDSEDEEEFEEEEEAEEEEVNQQPSVQGEEQPQPTRLPNSKYSSFAMSPDFGLLDLLRQALIALSLMPENSSAGLVILTDGVISVPDGRYLDIILSQLRYNTVSCSFIQLSSPFHPHLCHGVIPYADLLKFVASATFGAYLHEAPEIVERADAGMNAYHNAFLAWSFHKTLQVEWNRSGPSAAVKPGEWSIRNKVFFSVRDMPIVKKQQYENKLLVDHMKVMSCRLREGFTIKEVVTTPRGGLSELTLILPWKFLIHIEYRILINNEDFLFDDDMDELDESGYPTKVRCVVSLEGPYDFLHDVTCLAKKPFPSLYRQLMVNRFWATRRNLSESDRLLVHLNSFSKDPTYYNIPDSLRSGMPLFYWGSANANGAPQLHSNELSHGNFTNFWKPVCLLDTTVWQKWMHTHRIGVILEHDYPLPKNLHLANSTGRYNVIQCRQAVMALNTLLKNMSSFVLLENQSYVHLMFKSDEDKVPHSFCLIRLTSKPPHVVLRLAFLVGTPGHLRHRTVAYFREKIRTLTFPQRVKGPPRWRVIMNSPAVAKAATTASPLVNKTSWSEMPCCLLVHKPVEKILIRYDKRPDDFRRRLLSREESNMYVPEGKSPQPTQSTFGFRPTYQAPVGSSGVQMLPEVFNTIARYLHHRRWIWWFPRGELPLLSAKWASEILATVTKMRLEEGFRFAFSSSGIINMVLELPMKSGSVGKSTVSPMVVQYLVFPPTPSLLSNEDDSFDLADSLYLVTECWVEPQAGNVTNNPLSDGEEMPTVSKTFLNLDYSAIPKVLAETDLKCISLVGTFEYLVRICNDKEANFLIQVQDSHSGKPVVEENETIDVLPFVFDLRQLLMRSGQVEMLFSSFFQDLSLTFPTEWNASVCVFFERANRVLYGQWCANIASFQHKEVQLASEQHDVVTLSVIQRKGFDEVGEEELTKPKVKSAKGQKMQWRCFVRSSSSTHVLLTLVPATLKDLKMLLLLLDPSLENLHKSKSSRYVDFQETEEVGMQATAQCPNQVVEGGGTNLASVDLADHHERNCRSCSAVRRKRARAFSGGSECAPAVKRFAYPHVSDEKTGEEGDPMRSATFSEGTISGKLAHFMRNKRALSEQSGVGGGSEPNSGLVESIHQQQQEQDGCSDPQRCHDLNDYLNRCGFQSGGGGGEDRFVPCRPPVVGSLAFCLFTYSCSLMGLTEDVVFRKLNRDESTKDLRLSRVPPHCDHLFGENDEDDDNGGSLGPNGRSISQESFSETSLQRLEAAEHEQLLKRHCLLLQQAHLQSFIGSAYKSLLAGYAVNSCDVLAVVERSALTRVQFPLDTFLQHICKHDKDAKNLLEEWRAEGVGQNETGGPTELKCCTELTAIHNFIRKRFRRLLSRNFSPTVENGHVLFYKIAGSAALSDVSGQVKCSSDLEDNLDSCSVVADSLCSAEETFPYSLHIPSDSEVNEKSPAPSRAGGKGSVEVTGLVGDEQQSLAPSQFTLSTLGQCSPLFSYLTCALTFKGQSETGEGEEEEVEEEEEKDKGHFIPLHDIPTCFQELCLEQLQANTSEAELEELFCAKPRLTMELTFLTCPEERRWEESDEADVVVSKAKKVNSFEVDLCEFKKRVSMRQSRALDQLISDIGWLMEDEINSFRGGAGGNLRQPDCVNASMLESISGHVERSVGKPGCLFQEMKLSFVEHSNDKGFHSLVEKLSEQKLSEFRLKEEEGWWYVVKEEEGKELVLPPFWLILKAEYPSTLKIYSHCRYDEGDPANLSFSRSLRARLNELVSSLVRTINQDLLLQQLHDTRICSQLLELEDQDLEESALEMMMGLSNLKAGSESDLSSSLPISTFRPGMFSCQVVWVTTFLLHSRLRSGGGKTAFARGIQTLRSTLTAFEVANRKNMFVYRDAGGNVFYMRFYRGVDVLEDSLLYGPSSPGKPSLESTALDDYPESENASVASDSCSVNRLLLRRVRTGDSESEKGGRDESCEGLLALKVHGIVAAGEEIKEKLVQSLRNKLDDAVLDILSVTLKRNPHCKLTPEDVRFLQKPRSQPDSVIRFRLSGFIVGGRLPAFTYYLHQNLLQLLSVPKYTSPKVKYHFHDYSRLGDEGEEEAPTTSVYLYNQSPGGGGTGNRGIAIVTMAVVDAFGNVIKEPKWKHPVEEEFKSGGLAECICVEEIREEEEGRVTPLADSTTLELSIWKQGRLNIDLLRGHIDSAIQQAGWDLVMEFKVLSAPFAISTTINQQESLEGANMAAPGTGQLPSATDEPRIRSMSFTGVRKERERVGSGCTSRSERTNRDRAPSPVMLGNGRESSEDLGRKLAKSQPKYDSFSEKGEGPLHPNYMLTLDEWVERGINFGAPSIRSIKIKLNCTYPVRCLVREVEKVIGQVANDLSFRQFWRHAEVGGEGDIYLNCGGHTTMDNGLRRSSCGELSAAEQDYSRLRRHERELLRLEETEEVDYPAHLLNLFVRPDNFDPRSEGHVCYLLARNFAHWKTCVGGEGQLSASQDFKNGYKFAPLLNEVDGSRGSIEKLSRWSVAKEFTLWGSSASKNISNPILIPRQRFLRAQITSSEINFVAYNWSKECSDRLVELAQSLVEWVEARAALLDSLLLQKSGIFYFQPVLGEGEDSHLRSNEFLGNGEVELKELILHSLPPSGKRGAELMRSAMSGRVNKPKPINSKASAKGAWTEFYRNTPLRNLLCMPEPSGENPVDSHGRQLLHVIRKESLAKEQNNHVFQHWLTRGPSASNVITPQLLDRFRQNSRTAHFCLTPIMFLASWRGALAQTRDSSASGGILRRHRASSRRLFQSHALHPPPLVSVTTKLSASGFRVRHGSEASQASALSLRNRSRSYHSGMVNMSLQSPSTPLLPSVASSEFEGFQQTQTSLSQSLSTQQQQEQSLLSTVKMEEPWHAVLSRGFLQEYMTYLQTLGFDRVYCRSAPEAGPTPNPRTQSVSVEGVGVECDEGSEDDERMVHFLQRCLPGGIMVLEVGLTPPFLYVKLHALESSRIFQSKGASASEMEFVEECENVKRLTHLHSFMYDFHLRAMFLYISGKQLLFKQGYHITTFLDDFISYYPKCPNFSRNAIHIGMLTLEEVSTPPQVLFNYILGHDKKYRMKVIRMSPCSSSQETRGDENSTEYVLVHNLSRKVNLRPEEHDGQLQEEFDLTLVIAHDYPSSSRDFIPQYQGLRVKYYILITSRRELYPKGDDAAANATEPTRCGRLCAVKTPEPLCSSQRNICSQATSLSLVRSGLVPPPPTYFEGFEGEREVGGRREAGPGEMIREEGVSYMGYFSSHEQLMQNMVEEQRESMENFITKLITKAAVDCRRELLWQRLLTGRPVEHTKLGKGKWRSATLPSLTLKEDIISRETLGPLYYSDFNELLRLVQVVPLNTIDPRLEELVSQSVSFYQTLIKVLMGGAGNSHDTSGYNSREFISPDGQLHQLAIFTPEAHKSVLVVEVGMREGKGHIFALFKDGKKEEECCADMLGEPFYALVERMVNACCYTTWTALI